MRALVQKEIFEKSSNIPFLLKWFPMPETNHFLPWAFQKCHVVRKWFPFGNDFFGNHFHLEMIFLNDLLPQKMISGCFLRKKMIYRCEKSFPSSSEMIFYTRKWFRINSKMIFLKWFLGHFLPVLKMWFTLEKKNISFGNGHFRKWMEIIFFQKMLYNLPKMF